MNDQDQDNSAVVGQQLDSIEEHQTTTNQAQFQSSTISDEDLTLAMGASKSSAALVNGSPTPAPIESTEKSDISKGVKSRRSRTKATSTPPPPRRSTRRNSKKFEDEKTASVEQLQSSQSTETSTNTTKSKSRVTLVKSTSPTPASNTPKSSRSKKRKAVEPEEAEPFASTHDEENQLSQNSTGTTHPPAKKQKQQKSRAARSTTPSIAPTHSSKRKSSISEKNVSLPAVDNQDEIPSSPVSDRDDFGPSEFEMQRLKNGYDPLYDPNFVLPPEEDDLRGYESSAPEEPLKSRSPSVSIPRPSSRASKRKASELEEHELDPMSHEVTDLPTLLVPEDDGAPSTRLRRSPSSSSSSTKDGNSNAITNEASDRDATEAVMEAPDATHGFENSPIKKRGRPAGGRPTHRQTLRKAANAVKKSALSGRKKKTSEDVKVQAAYDRMVELKKSYKEIAKGIKPALAMIADRAVESMMEDPKAHEKVPAFQTVTTGLDSIHNAYLTKLEQQYEFQRSFIDKRRNQEDEYSNMQLKYAVRDIFEKTVSRAKAAFMVAHKAGTREEIVEDDDVSIDENRDANLRDLNAFNVPENVEAVASNLDLVQPGTSTPRKSPSKKRSQNDSSFSEVNAITAPIAKHSLLAVTQEHEPSSTPTSRVATPEPVDNGVFDEYGVHIPNRVRRGRMVEPNNRAIVKSWVEYDEWDIQYQVMASRKKAKNHSTKTDDLVYLDQISFSSQGGGGYRLSTNKPEDFNQDTIKRYGLHPRYGIPIKGSKNPDYVVPPTNFNKPLDKTRPVLVVDVEETRPVSAGGTRKPAELPEPQILSRSAAIIYADKDFDEFVIRQNMAKALNAHSPGAGHPSVKGLATYDGVERDEQRAAEGISEILEASEIVKEELEKKASAAAAAAAANIAHKSSIFAIVNSEDGGAISGAVSQVNKQNVNSWTGYVPQSAPGFDALLAAIDIKKANVPAVPSQGFYPVPQARDYGARPREYSSQDNYLDRSMQQPPHQPYVQQQVPMAQQVPLQHPFVQYQQAPVPQQPLPYNTGANSQSQQPIQMHFSNGGGPSLLQHQMMQTLHPQNMAPAVPSPYSRPLQTQSMAPPAPRGYHQFSHYVPPQPRPTDQSHLQAPQPPRSQRELRPAPPLNGPEWPKRQQEAPFYQNGSPGPSYQVPSQGHAAFTWAPQHQVQQPQQMQQPQQLQQPQQIPQPQQMQQQQQQQQLQQGLPPSQAQQHPPPPPPSNQPFAGTSAAFPSPQVQAHAISVDEYLGEGASPSRKSTQNQSKRGKKK